MYSPKLRADQIHQLYLLRRLRKRPMTKLVQQIVDEYLTAHQEELRGVAVETVVCTEIRRVS